MAIVKKLVVKTGSYERNGKTVGRYETVGHIHEGEHGEYITIKASVNFAAFPRKEGDDRVSVNLFDPDDKSDRETAARGVTNARQAMQSKQSDFDQASFDDSEIPF